MKASATFISTLKEAPADAEIASHRLMMRAGFIKRLGAGIYNYMPLGLRVTVSYTHLDVYKRQVLLGLRGL